MAKYALITGASRGIGKSIAIQLAKEGYYLYLTCHKSEQAINDLAHSLSQEYSISCQTFIGDLSDYDNVVSLFKGIHQLDVVINNAGISHVGLLSDMSVTEWHTVINTNLSSAFYICKNAIPLMLSKQSGKIINISSVWGNVGASMEVAYSTSKGGLNTFTKALAKELAPSNIQVNAIACGLIDTDMNACFSEEELNDVICEIPADRIGKPDEVALMVSQILSSPSYLTGQIISLDGGWC